jgi:PAS domain S-box-containing protein
MRIDIPPGMKEEMRHAQAELPLAPPPAERVPNGKPMPSIGSADFQELFQSVYDGAVIATLDGHIVDANARAADRLQRTHAELCQCSLVEIISGADADTLRTLRASMEKERFVVIQAYCLRKDGALFPAEIAVNRLNVVDNAHYCCFIRDVTWRWQAEERLRTVHNAIQNAATGIAVADRRGKLGYVNPATLKLWGVEEKDALLGKNLQELFPDPAQAKDMIATVMSGRRWTEEIALPRKDGAILRVRVSAAENRNADDEVIGMVLAFLDLSDRYRAEEAQKQTERQRVMIESIGAACHHLGQPATVLLASLELLVRNRAGSTAAISEDLLSSSVEAAESIRQMLHKLNDIAEYRTTPYIEGQGRDGLSGARILEVKDRPVPG